MRKQWVGIALIGLLGFPGFSWGAPVSFSYQGRIVGTNGPLEYPAVSFEFSITNPTGTCTLYREQKNGVNMTHSKGVFDTEIGTGTKLHPSTVGFDLFSAFQSGVALNCEEGGTYTAAADDARGLRVQFYDGSTWRRISPLQTIRSVPFAGYAYGADTAQKLGNNVATDFLLKTGIPVCASGDILTSTTSGVLTCVHDTGGAAGSVNAVAGSGAITVTESPPSSGNYTIAATTGTTAGTLVVGNDGRLAPAPASASGKYLKSDGTAWVGANITFADIKNSAGSSAFNIGSCAANQTMKWSSLTDMFECQNIASLAASAISSGVMNTARLGTGTADNTTYLRGDGTWAAVPSVTETDPKVGANTTNYLSKWNGSALVASTVIESSGNVGIGVAAPTNVLDIQKNSGAMTYVAVHNTNTGGGSGASFYNDQGMLGEITVPGSAAGSPWQNRLNVYAYPGAGGINIATSGSGDDIRFFTDTETEAARILSSGNFGIGTATPGAKLEVAGTVKITGGSPGAGKVLTSDAAGLASWQSPAAGGSVTSVTAGTGIVTSPGGGITTTGSVGLANIADKTILANVSGSAAAPSATSLSALVDAATSTTQGSVLYRDASGWVALAPGTSGQFLQTQGASSNPQWASPASTNLASGVTGTLPVANGGTGATSLGSGNLLVGAGTGAVTSLAAGTAGNVVYATGAAAWSSGTPDTAGLVDKSSTQVISGAKGFTNYVQMSAQNELRLADADSSNYVALRSPATIGTNYTLTFPAAVGAAGNVLTTDASGNLSWTAPAAGTQWTTSGSDIYYNTGNVGIGTNSPWAKLQVDSNDTNVSLALINESSSAARYPGQYVVNYTGGNGGSPSYNLQSGRGTAAAPAAVAALDLLGHIAFYGQYDTTPGHMANGAQILTWADGAFSATSSPATMVFSTTPAGSTTPVYRMTISSGGNVGIGTTSPAATLDVNGAIKGTTVANATNTIDFAGGNIQYTTADCGATQMSNLKSGATYNLVFQGTTGGTCSFTAYSGSGTTGPLTVKSGSTNLVQSSSTHIIFSFMVVGSYVYVMSAEGF